tara:strand:- start:308 stop:553 length:246 start_codon:yes stop_codon:yes gene_type:complete
MVENFISYHYLDLRGLTCPTNFVKCCLALENVPFNEALKVDLDAGESENSVKEGLLEKGYQVNILAKENQTVSLLISSEQK